MTIGDQLEKHQPELYNAFIERFDLDFNKTDRNKPEERDFPEDDNNFKKYKTMMEKPRGFKL